jgi:hypothetical protein
MTPAPAFTCFQCGRRIGQARMHCLVSFADGVWCVTCVEAADDYANGFDAYDGMASLSPEAGPGDFFRSCRWAGFTLRSA